MNIQVSDIGHIIQLAIAPVFLLTGVATKLSVLINRLARIIDRTRVLEDRLLVANNERYTHELSEMYKRSHLINYAITCSTHIFECVDCLYLQIFRVRIADGDVLHLD